MTKADAIQKRLNQLAQHREIRAALLVMAPRPHAEEFRFEAKATATEVWPLILAVAHRFNSAGKAQQLHQEAVMGDVTVHLLADRYQGPEHSPYLIAAIEPLRDVYHLSSLRNVLEKVAGSCLDEANSRRWY